MSLCKHDSGKPQGCNGGTVRRRQTYKSSHNDLTIYDFAHSNAPAKSGRVRKGLANSTTQEVKKLNCVSPIAKMKEEEEEVEWFDKDLDEFDIPTPGKSKENEENSEEEEAEADVAGDQAEPIEFQSWNNRSRQQRRKKRRDQEMERKKGVVYPADLWYLLSEYIQPEAINKFAVICSDSYKVTTRRLFWRKLYQRYDCTNAVLPQDLKPDSMERNHGLRARCIRAMHILDPSLAQRVQPKGPFDPDPHSLVGYRCMLFWHQPSQGKWQFCFKLRKPSLHVQEKNRRPIHLEDIKNGFDNLFYNPEENCCILQVTTSHFLATSPRTMGQLLTDVHLALGLNLRHRLRLTFDSRCVLGAAAADQSTECIIDPVLAIRIMHWWDPKYPFPT